MWTSIRENLSREIKNLELNTKELTFSQTREYIEYFELAYYNNFCEGYRRQKPLFRCTNNILESGMNVVIQYLINYNIEIMANMSVPTNRLSLRTEILEGMSIFIAGKQNITEEDTANILAEGCSLMRGMLLEGMLSYTQSANRASISLIICRIIILFLCVAMIIHIYIQRIDYEYQRMLMILRFFSEAAIRRNKIVMYLLHRYKILTL